MKQTSVVLEDFVQKSVIKVDIIFVDDGSADKTKDILESTCRQLSKLDPDGSFSTISYEQNKGKGWALKQGINACKTLWCLTLDADMASEPAELIMWMDDGLVDFDGHDVYIGSREMGILKGWVESTFLRRRIGLIFNSLVRMYTGLPFTDTQCGFKLYRSEIAKRAFENLVDYGFAHDVEVLYNIKNSGTKIVPLAIHWREVPGSKVNVFSDGLKMFSTIRRIKSRRN